jgi:predicted MPP superfamily phosphohydrolase
MNKALVIPIFGIVLILIDLYAFQAFKVIAKGMTNMKRKIIYTGYWAMTVSALLAFFIYNLLAPNLFLQQIRYFMIVCVTIIYFAKLFSIIFIFLDDMIYYGRKIIHLLRLSKKEVINESESSKITRSQFLAWSAVLAGTVPVAAMTFGIVSGAHDYRIRRQKLRFPDLPSSFDGLKIIQVSDIHSGSFYNKTAVRGGVEMVLNEKPDVIFFTGDLVNEETSEVDNYINIFDKVKAPLGVFSITGNHDYGDYRLWSSTRAKEQNFNDLIEAHRLLGWDLLMNENRFLEAGGEKIAIIGIENWGTGRFPKYGKLARAYEGTEDTPVKILLSHDPSHWDAQVRSEYTDIDLMLAGHTHGFQFGVETDGIKWSPSQWIYKQWAGLYQEGKQFLYVNRGYGYIGYPGRIGILPEITVLELKKS